MGCPCLHVRTWLGPLPHQLHYVDNELFPSFILTNVLLTTGSLHMSISLPGRLFSFLFSCLISFHPFMSIQALFSSESPPWSTHLKYAEHISTNILQFYIYFPAYFIQVFSPYKTKRFYVVQDNTYLCSFLDPQQHRKCSVHFTEWINK